MALPIPKARPPLQLVPDAGSVAAAGTAGSAQPEGPPSFDELFRRYARYIGAVALRVLGDETEVDDVVQEVFLIALSHLRELRNPEAARGWLATIAVRRASRRLQLRRLRRLLGLGSRIDHAPAPTAPPETQALLRRVYAALEDLPVAERVAWTLRYIEGEALEDVARLCRCSLATAKRRIAAAQERLKGSLVDE